MEEKKIKMEGGCLVKYESCLTENGKVCGDIRIDGKGIDIVVGLRCIINHICRKNNIPIFVFLGMIEHISVEGISIDVGAIEAMEGSSHE